MFNSTLVGNARNWFSKLPRRSIDGFEELRRAFRLNFTQRKKCAKNPVELARVKQRHGESKSALRRGYKDECIPRKAMATKFQDPKGPSFKSSAAFADSRKVPNQVTRNSQEENPMTQCSLVATTATLPVRGKRAVFYGEHKYTTTDNDPKG
ncbi:reverse transcriptase domain-containing protein [Tanacetum coccineum]